MCQNSDWVVGDQIPASPSAMQKRKIQNTESKESKMSYRAHESISFQNAYNNLHRKTPHNRCTELIRWHDYGNGCKALRNQNMST